MIANTTNTITAAKSERAFDLLEKLIADTTRRFVRDIDIIASSADTLSRADTEVKREVSAAANAFRLNGGGSGCGGCNQQQQQIPRKKAQTPTTLRDVDKTMAWFVRPKIANV